MPFSLAKFSTKMKVPGNMAKGQMLPNQFLQEFMYYA